METFESNNIESSKDNYMLVLEKKLKTVNKILNSKAFTDLCSYSDRCSDGWEIDKLKSIYFDIKELDKYYHRKLAEHKNCKIIGVDY